MYSLLIKNARVIDGTGQPGEVLDVAVQGDEIVNVAHDIKTPAQTVIDGSGLVLCPGFIDVQNHSDVYWQLFNHPQLESLITQGYTTIFVGNCGGSLAPLLSPQALSMISEWHKSQGVNINWQSFSQYVEELSRLRLACNVGSLVGYETLRRSVTTRRDETLNEYELIAAKRILQESLETGAFGLSVGFISSHQAVVSQIEIFELAELIRRQDAVLSIHLRNEADQIVEALEEALDLARRSGVQLKISHLKIRGKDNWRKADEVLQLLETAYMQGVRVHFDAYPYATVWQPLLSYLPKWLDSAESLSAQLQDDARRDRVLEHLRNLEVKFPDLLVTSTTNRFNFVGKKIGQIAKNLEISSEETVLNLIQNGGREVMVFDENLDEQIVDEFIEHPLSFVATDGGGFGLNEPHRLVHPRCFGAATRFLKKIAKTKKITLAEAVQKLTSNPAKKMGLKKRGEIKIGNFADLVLFHPQTLSDKATYENPYQFSTGIQTVFVNGKMAVKDGQPTGQLTGYILRR